MKLLLVFNPTAAAGRAKRLLPAVRTALERFAVVDVIRTDEPGEAIRSVAAAELSVYDGLIAAGGDGTLFEVLNGMYLQDKSRHIPLGLIPVGTGNAFARDLGLMPRNWQKAVELVRAGVVRQVDVGQVETPDETYFFLNIVGAGLPVDAMKVAGKLKILGNTAYTVATLWCALKLTAHPMVIEIDGEKVHQDSMFVEVSNTRYTGTSFLIAPGAELDDGLLDVTLLGRLSRLRLLRLFPTIYRGQHVHYPEIRTFKGKKIRITGPANLLLAPDGELTGRTPTTITCLKKDLRIFAPV